MSNEQTDRAFAVERLEDYASQCLTIAVALQQDKPIAHVLHQFRGAWLMMQVILDVLAEGAHEPDGEEAFRQRSARVIDDLRDLRREVLRGVAPPA